jgi:exopolysaccharide biosynthesis polyprenyl glycosylphosphotransferase
MMRDTAAPSFPAVEGATSRLPFPYVRFALLAGDIVALSLAFLFALLTMALTGGATISADSPSFTWALPAPIWLLYFWQLRLYARRIDLSVVSQLPKIVAATSLASMTFLALQLMVAPLGLPASGVQHQVVILAWLFSLALFPAIRLPIRSLQKAARRRGMSEKRTLIVGAGAVGSMLAAKMRHRPEHGLCPVGFLDPDPPAVPGRDSMGLPVYRNLDHLDEIIEAHRIDHILVAFSSDRFNGLITCLERCSNHPVEISVVPRLFEVVASKPSTDEIEGVPIMSLRRPGLTPAGAAFKRIFDLVAAALVLSLVSPLLLVLICVIWYESGRPAFFRQTRIGKNGRPFTMLKLRSMVPDAETQKSMLLSLNESSGPMFKIQADPRVTRVGRFLRKCSLDELPQLLNVLKGEMSLVGPRPPLPDEVREYSAWHMKRLAVVPGITGLWQVLGRVEISFEEMVSLDLNYIWNWSPWLDLSILARTAGAVINRKGAC